MAAKISTDLKIPMADSIILAFLENLKKHTVSEVGISSITLAELQYGVAKSRHRKTKQNCLCRICPAS